ncbi:Uncharacterised protein [Serratia rubidaea]|uniref:Uncharacterized protein n=1 Tax=Serratia rubidaea TaxID=61652 RepID=A0A4V6JIJ4_SERRU|nr:Uncharacterised protein [Serratia rubidaea]
MTIGMQEIHPANFASVQAMVTLVQRLQGGEA